MIQAEDFGQDRCIECGACDESCPSARHGGISPRAAVGAYRDGTAFTGEWRCLQCHRCDAACPEKIDISGIVRSYRYASYKAGNVPERFLRAEKQYLSELRMFPMIGRTVSQRSELGLDTLPMDPEEEAKCKASLKEVWNRE